jgi:hypothetical protein
MYMRDNRPFDDRPAHTPRRIFPTMLRDLSYEADCKLSAIVEPGCQVHARPPFLQMADLTANAHRKA